MILFKKISALNLKIIFLFLGILPFFILAFFARPAADEYAFSTELASVSSLEFTYNKYMTWSGRFFSFFFVSVFLKMIMYWDGFYVIFTFLILLISLWNYYWIIDKFNFTNSVKEKLLLTISLFVLYVYGMPSLAEGFYWFICSFAYMLTNSLVVFWIGFLIEREHQIQTSKSSFKQNLVIYFFTFALCGSMELFSSFVVGFVAVIWITKLMTTKKIDTFYSLLFVFTLTFSCLSIFSVGNAIRGTGLVGLTDPVFILSKLIPNSLNYIFYWFFETPILVFTLFYLPFAQKIVANSPLNFAFKVNPFWALIVWIGVVFGCFSIGYISIGGELPTRINNVVYFFFLAGWFYVVTVFFCSYSSLSKEEFSVFIKPSVFTKLVVPVVIFLFLYKENNAIRAAYADILKGRAYNYAVQFDNRQIALENCKSDTCIVAPINNPPHTIYEPSTDLRTDPKHWNNLTQATYFGVKAIKVEE